MVLYLHHNLMWFVCVIVVVVLVCIHFHNSNMIGRVEVNWSFQVAQKNAVFLLQVVLRSLISQETVGRYDIYKCLATPKLYTAESRGARCVVG